MVARPLDLPGSDAYVQDWARTPSPEPPAPDPGAPPPAVTPPHVPYGETYEPAVERLRPLVESEFARQGVPTVDSRGNDLIDKTLHVATYESHGDDTIVGDGGAAYGVFQSHYIPHGTPLPDQVADAVRLIAKNPEQFTDWGEGVTYQGQPFGALGRVPYGSAPPAGYGGDIGSAISGVGSALGTASDALTRRNRALIPANPDAPLITQLPGRQAGGFRDTETQPDPNATFDDPFSAASHAIGKGVTNAYDAGVAASHAISPATVQGLPQDTLIDPLDAATHPFEGRVGRFLGDAANTAGNALGQAGADFTSRPQATGTGIGRGDPNIGRTAGTLLGQGLIPRSPLDFAMLGTQAPEAIDAAKAGSRAVIEKAPGVIRAGFPEAAPVGSAEYFAGLGGGGGGLRRQVEEQAARDAAEAAAATTEKSSEVAAQTAPPAASNDVASSPASSGGGAPPLEPAAGTPPPSGAPGRAYDPATMDPATIDELRQKLRHDYQTGATPPPISEAELKQQLREGIAPGEETPQSVLDRFREDPSSVEKGDLHSALSKIAISQGTKADLADQLEQSIETLKKATRSGAITPEDAKASEMTLRKAWMDARPTNEPGPVQGLDGLAEGVAAQPLPPEQPNLFMDSVQKSLANAEPAGHGPEVPPLSREQRTANELAGRGDLNKGLRPYVPTEEEAAAHTSARGQRIAEHNASAEEWARANAARAKPAGMSQAEYEQMLADRKGPNAGGISNPVNPADYFGTNQVELGRVPTPEAGPELRTPSLDHARLNRGLTEPSFQGEGVSNPNAASTGLFPGPLFEEGANHPGGAISGAPSDDERAAHFAQHIASNFKHVQVPGNVQKAYRNAIALANAPTRFLTYGHLPVLRQGFGFALTHPSTAREAIQNLATVARNPEAWGALNEGLNKGVFVKAAMDAGWLHEAERPTEAAVTQVINKIPGMLRSGESARAYLTTLRKAGYESEAARLYHAGIRDQASYESLWNTISDVTGHGLRRGQSISAGGMSPVLSPQALAGRFRSLVDPFIQKGSINPLAPGARSVAIRNLIALGGVSAAINGISKAAGADLNWDLKTPLGKVQLGESTLDPSTGLGSIVKLAIKLAEVTPGAVHGNLTPLRDALGSYFRGQLGPVPEAAYSTWTGQDWQGKPFNLGDRTTTGDVLNNEAYRSLVPIALQSTVDAIKANGPIGALYAVPSYGAMSVETNLVTAARDKAAQSLGAKDYASAGPEIRNQVQNDPAVLRAQGAPTPYQAAAAKAHAPILAEVSREEALHDAGTNDKKLADVYHDEGVANRQAAHDLEGQFASQFANFSKTKYTKAVEGYYGTQKLIPDGETGAGGVDFDATAAAQQDYLDKLPADEKAWVTEALNVTEGKKSAKHQAYDEMIKTKKSLGYFADGVTPEQRTALDKAHPDLDVMNWYLGGQGKPTPDAADPSPSLHSYQAAQGALKLNLGDARPIKVAGMSRPINETPGMLAAWQATDSKGRTMGQRAQDYIDGYANSPTWKAENDADRDPKSEATYGKSYDKLDPWQKKAIDAKLLSGNRTEVRDDPRSADLHAYLAYSGVTNDIADDDQDIVELRKLRAKYGRESLKKDAKPITYR